MAVLIIIGTTVVVGTVAYRLYDRFNKTPTPPTDIATISAPNAEFSLTNTASPLKLPSNEHIAAIAAAGADLAVLITSPKGEEVMVINPASGSVRTILTTH